MSGETLVSLFFRQAEEMPEHPLLMVKRDGAYRELLWKDIAERVRAIAAGLIGRGVKHGDRVGVVSENRQEFIETDFGIMSTGAITVALHAPLSAAQVRAQFSDSTPIVIFISTLAQRDKLESVRADLPSVQHVFAFDPLAVDGREVESMDTLMAEGRALLKEQPNLIAESVAAVTPEDIAALIYTSGTTGESKGAMLTHFNFYTNCKMAESHLEEIDRPDRMILCFLPQSHVYARACDVYTGVLTARTLAIAEGVEHLLQNLQEVKPHYMSAVPRVWEKIAGAAKHLMSEGKPDALRQMLGGRVKWLGVGGAALSPDITQFYMENGIPVFQGYGLTETSPVISMNYKGNNKPGSSGQLVSPEVEVKIEPDGEILTRGPHVMKGYWNNPKATAEAIDPEGWFHTGDVGYMDEDGYLYITDRKKDIIVTAYGKNVAPQQIESLLCFDPLIDQAFVYGDGKKFLTALIVPSAPAVKVFASRYSLGDLSVADLLAMPEAYPLFELRINQALSNLASHEQIKKFILLPEPFSFEEGSMTVTAKLRRKQIIEKYWVQLEGLYIDTSESS